MKPTPWPWAFTAARIGEVVRLIETVSFPGYTFHLFGTSFLAVCASFNAPCNEAGGPPTEQFTRLWLLDPDASDEAIVQTCLKLVLTAVEHEARELFKVNGVAIYGPHLSLPALSTAALASRGPSV